MPSLEDLTTDQLLAHARALEGSHNLLNTLSGNPETRTELQRLMKKVNPKLVIPEIDTADAVRGEMKVRDERIASLENKILEGEVRGRMERQRAAAQVKYNLSDADLLEVEKLMIDPDPDKRVPGYESAARVFTAERQNAKPTPASFSPPVFTMPENDVWGKGIGNKQQLDKIALTEAYSAWNEVASGRTAQH